MRLIRPKVISQYRPLYDPSVREVVEPSPRITGKTTSNEQAAITAMLQDRRNNIVYCRAEKNDIRNTIFSSMLSTIQMLDAEDLFTSKTSPFEITCKRTGAKCYFLGINGTTESDVSATKGFIPQGGTVKYVIVDEADTVKHPNHLQGLETTISRFLMEDSKIIYAHNPAIQRGHWSNKFFGDKVRHGATRIFLTWEDIRGVLSPAVIRQIEHMRDTDPELYRYWYLGEPVIFRGMVYPQLDRKKHCVDIFDLFAAGDQPVRIFIGVDEGTVFDSTCAVPILELASGRSVVIGCFENDPVQNQGQSPSTQSRHLQEWWSRFLVRYKFAARAPAFWVFDCAESGQGLMRQFREDSGAACKAIWDKSIMGDIKRVRTMLDTGSLLFYDDGENGVDRLLLDMQDYMFDERTSLPKKGQRDDTIDALEYATKPCYDTTIVVEGGWQ